MKSDWADTDEKRREIEQKLKTAANRRQMDTCMRWNTAVERAEANGTKFDESYRVSTNSAKVHTAFLADPRGTRIELTEGLTPQGATD